jgi:hypothetical protein
MQLKFRDDCVSIGGRSVGAVRLQTKATEFSLVMTVFWIRSFIYFYGSPDISFLYAFNIFMPVWGLLYLAVYKLLRMLSATSCNIFFFKYVTCKGLAWLIMMGTGFDDWIYWTSLLQLQLIITAHTLNSFWTTSVLRMLYEESLIALKDVWLANGFLKSLLGTLYKLARIHGNPYKWFVATETCLPKRWLLSNRSSTVDCVTTGICLPKRCLTDGHIPSQYV